MEGDDETMSTITATNEDELPVLKPLNTIWDCEFMTKDVLNGTWTCHHCDTTLKKINATKALAHVLSLPNAHVSSCSGGIARKYSIRYTNLEYEKKKKKKKIISRTMAPRQKGKKKTATNSDGGNEDRINLKRQCTTSTRATTSTTRSVSVKKEENVEVEVAGGSNPFVPDPIPSATDPDSTITTNTTTTTSDDDDNEEEDDIKLPTSLEVSKELCKTVLYSRAEACRALDKLFQWADIEDSEFMKSFYMYAGIIKVIDFLKATLNDLSCVGTVRMECIKKAAEVIGQVCYSRADDRNIEIVTKIATLGMDYNCMNTLLSASDEYSGEDDVPRLQALDGVWFAMRNISFLKDIVISQDQAIILFEAGIDILSNLKSYNGPVVSNILEHAFNTLGHVVKGEYVDKRHFQNKNIFSKCLNVFRKNGIWGDRSEKITDAAIDFFDDCQRENLLEDSDDFEMILPFLAVGLKKFGSNQHSNNILANAITLIHEACDSINDKKIIEKSGVMEHLSVLLASDDINDDQKKKVRKVIGKITAP